jgi:hypothetical protein
MRTIACVKRTLGSFAGSTLLALATLAESPADIRDIRGPKALPVWPWLAATLLGSVLVALYVAHRVRSRRRAGAAGRKLTLTEQTLERLEEARPLMQPSTAREFGIATSEVIRQYIEQRFDVGATQRTTEEFLQALLESPNQALVEHRALLANFLQQCDFVKFAGTSLGATDLEALFQSARGFVLKTGEAAST